jgi:hypothetical protein
MDVNQALRDIGEETWGGGAFPAIEGGRDAFMESTSNKLSKYTLDLWNLGWSDGLTGQSSAENIELIRKFAETRKKRHVHELRAELAKAQGAYSDAEERARDAAVSVDRTEKKLNALVEHRREKPHEFSPLSGVVFLVVSMILILSDIPLTIQLVGEALGLETWAPIPDDGTGHATTLKIGNILFGPMREKALELLWEAAAVALGIAMLGMFFKLASDFLLGDKEFFTRYRWLVHARPILQVAFFALAFALTCWTLWDLGALRAAARAKGGPPQDLVDMTFKLLAIALPAIGGICFSLGQKRLQNWWELLTTRALIFRHRRALRIANHHAAIQKAAAHSLNEAIDHEIWQQEEFSVPEKVYTHAYDRGVRSFERPDNQTIHDRCMALVHRAIAAGMR